MQVLKFAEKDEYAKQMTYWLFVLEDNDGDDDHKCDKWQPQVDDQQAHVDWLWPWSETWRHHVT